MDVRSLKARLLLAAAVGITIFLFIAGTAFYFIFQHHAEQLARRELENDFVQLISAIHIDDRNQELPHPVLSDPRFEKPYGGLYWQIDEAGKPPVRSRSLFDVDLADAKTPGRSVDLITGPNNTPLFAIDRNIVLPLADGTERHLMITLAVERTDIDEAAHAFRRDLGTALLMLMAALLLGSLGQILIIMKPLQDLQLAVQSLQDGEGERLHGNFPSEVRPLAQNINELLDARATAVEKARQRASNLAHGLKTPLTVLNSIADELHADGDKAAGQAIRENAAHINEQVERELARARMSGGAKTSKTTLYDNVGRMVKTLGRTPEGSQLNWNITVPLSATIAMERGDLTEMLGNIMDNARKWAKSQVQVSFNNGILCVEDDGPGVAEDKLAEIEQRGHRLDHSTPGHGLGLAIVREMADTYGLEVKYKRSSLGGLSVNIARPEVLARLS